jgi:hypothetical protein
MSRRHRDILSGERAIMRPNRFQGLERVLESAVVVSWTDLIHGIQSGLVHIEYGLSPSGTLDDLQVWSSIRRGYWLLVCSYWMFPSELHDGGVHFDNGYQSERLAHILAVVMQHQTTFALPPNLGRRGLLQITTPTEIESTAAAASIRDASECAGSALAETLLARD